MESLGFEYLSSDLKPSSWGATVAWAAKFVCNQLEKAAVGHSNVLLEPINSARLQYKFPRSLAALPDELRPVVAMVEERMMAACFDSHTL